MRFRRKHQTSAAMKTKAFAGLGFDMETVHVAAQMMTPDFHDSHVDTGVALRVVDCVAQLSGYSLLVALGREIRGR